MRFFIIVLMLLHGGFLHAQEKPKTRTCRILFLDRPAGAPHTLQLFDGATSREVDLPGLNFSAPYTLPGGAIRLVMTPHPVNAPDALPAGAPSVAVPETTGDCYLILMHDAANKIAPVSMQLIDASMQRLKLGQTCWLNMTGLTIGAKLGDQNMVIKPMSCFVMNAPRQDAGDFPVIIAYQKAQKAYPICETSWTHDPRVRNLGFILMKEGSRTPRVFLIPDFHADLAQEAGEQHASPQP